MTVKASKAVRNHLLGIGNLSQIFKHGKLIIYSGGAPTNPEDAATGTALVTISDNSGSLTAEVLSTGTVAVTGTTGNITAVNINSVNIIADHGTVPFNTSTAQTASDLVDAINRSQSFPKYTAALSGSAAIISAARGSGTTPNGYTVDATGTLTTTDTNMAGGVLGANGLKFGAPAAGILSKLSTQTWSGTIANTGTAGYWRLYAAVSDSGALDSTESFPRLQGSIGTTASDINLTSTSLVAGATQTINTFSITMPA